MPFFDGTGPGMGKFGRRRGICGKNRNALFSNGLVNIIWKIGRFLVYSGIAGTFFKKFMSWKNNKIIETERTEELFGHENKKVIDAEWEKIDKVRSDMEE